MLRRPRGLCEEDRNDNGLSVTLVAPGGQGIGAAVLSPKGAINTTLQFNLTTGPLKGEMVMGELRQGTCAKFAPGAIADYGPFTGTWSGQYAQPVSDYTKSPQVILIRRMSDTKVAACGAIKN